MNFPLKNLEVHLDEHHFVLGERLQEEGKVENLRELEKHLWVAEVEDCEIEIQITPSKVRACTCDCEVFQSEQMCGHIAAALLDIRVRLTQEKKKRVKKITPKKLTVASVIENANTNELMAFMRQYAKTNRQFSLALKARFASAVSLPDNQEKYRHLLESAVNTHRKKNDSINFRGMQVILQVLKELMSQVDDAMAMENYTEGFAILESVVEKMTPVIGKADTKQEELTEVVSTALKKLKELMYLNPAPNLKLKIRAFCEAACVRKVYHLYNFSMPLFQLLVTLVDDKESTKTALQLIDNELNNPEHSHVFQAGLLILKVQLLEQDGRKAEADIFIQENLSAIELVIYLAQLYLDKLELEQAKFFANKGLEQTPTPEEKGELEEVLLEIALEEKDQGAIIRLARMRFLEAKTLKYYLYCKDNYKGDWQAFVETLLHDLQQQPFSFLKRDAIGVIYYEEQQMDLLFDYIESLQSLDLLKQYDVKLAKNYSAEIYGLYEKFLNNYLKTHFGRKPSQKIKTIIARLHDIGAHPIANRLVTKIRKEYGSRSSLLEELDVF